MGKGKHRLSVKETLKKDLKPGLYADGGGLYLQVSDRLTKAWVFRFMIAGRARKMGLGDYDRVSLADARKKAEAAHLQVVDGFDPIDQRTDRKAADAVARAKVATFKECAEKYITAHTAGWKSAKHAGQWRATLETYAYPKFGSLPVSSVDVGMVLAVLEQPADPDEKGGATLWAGKTETASRVRGRIENILDWARVRGLRQGENPARWRGHLDQLLPARSAVAPVQHHKAMPYVDLPRFMADLRARNSVSARALEFTILTAVRTSDTIEGTWQEVNDDARLWTIPGTRLKGKKGKKRSDHAIPLCDRAMTILENLPREGGYLFAGAEEGGPLSNMAMLEFLQGMPGLSDLTVHGFRSTFKDWCAEQTAYPNELSEMALAHTVSDKVEAAYRRGDMREKRRRLMEDWATYCSSPPAAVRGDNVVAMRAGA
jgi:integrase